MASLTPSATYQRPQSAREIVAATFHLPHHSLPPPSPKPNDILDAVRFEQLAGREVVSAIRNFTDTGYHVARLVECLSLEEAQKTQLSQLAPVSVSATSFEMWQRRCLQINKALAKMPFVKESVFRGMDLPAADLARWIAKWRSGEPIYLGPHDQPAISSATWNVANAKDFLVVKSGSVNPQHRLPVLIELTDHRGVGIQHISKFPAENEVLIPSNMSFVIEKIAPLDYFKPTIYIKMRGILPPKQPETAAIWWYRAPSVESTGAMARAG